MLKICSRHGGGELGKCLRKKPSAVERFSGFRVFFIEFYRIYRIIESTCINIIADPSKEGLP
jgi:hypothetical protein